MPRRTPDTTEPDNAADWWRYASAMQDCSDRALARANQSRNAAERFVLLGLANDFAAEAERGAVQARLLDLAAA